jgi:pimeloyl-ACP methyl ester carboxylesterase
VRGSPDPTAPPGRWRRRLRRTVVALVAVVAIAWCLGDGSPVGHFASAADQNRFLTAYQQAMARLPQPQLARDVRTRYGFVRIYRFTGALDDRPPLLLLPGRAAPTPVWADNLPLLLAQRSVYTVDLLGEPGLSVQSRPIANDDDQAAWLHEVLQQLPEPRLHVVGLSIGGWTAMNLAVHRPAKIASVTLIEPVFVFTSMSITAILRSIPASVPWLPRALRDDFNSWTANGAPVEHEPVAEMIEAGMQTYRLKLPIPGVVDPQAIGASVLPTLVILAADSRMHDASVAADAARRVLKHGTVKVYPGTSHAINGERPQEIAADIAAHLTRAETPAPAAAAARATRATRSGTPLERPGAVDVVLQRGTRIENAVEAFPERRE